MQDFAEVCVQAAHRGGEVLLAMQGKIKAREKAPSDLVTEADIASQTAIRDFVLQAYPSHGFLGEEDLPELSQSAPTSEFTWIVDPLDGTTNYVHGLENYCVSVALQKNHDIVAGAIYDPVRGDCYSAAAGGGAYCNGQPIRISEVNTLSQALVAASLPAMVQRDSEEVERFLDVLLQCQALRRMGSAALNLCYVASGKLDAYWATSVKKWDVAAGLIIVREAGGIVTDVSGGPLDIDRPRFISAGQASLHQELVQLLSKHPDA